jgi:RNA polymerase sigma-70 factor, ECF subfamily
MCVSGGLMQATGPGGRGRGLILGICCTSLFLTGLDTTSVNVALPSIGRDLHAPVSGLQWTVAAYTVALAGGGALTLGSSAIAWYLGRASAGSLTFAYALLGAGAGLCSPAITNTIMGGLPAAQATVASSISSASRQLGQTLGTAITGTVLIAGLGGWLHAGYARAGHPAWWVIAGFGAAIIPLTLASAHHAAPAHGRRRFAVGGYSAWAGWLAGTLGAGQPVAEVVLALPFGWARRGRFGAAGPPADVPEQAPPGSAAPVLHHERRPGRPGRNGSGGTGLAPAALPGAPAIALPRAGELHHERRPGRPAGTGLTPDAPGPHADAYRARRGRLPETGQSLLGFSPADGDTSRTQEWRAIAEALASLCPQHRQVIIEIYYRGCSVDETATTLGIPAGTVRSRMFYALKALELVLQERALPPPPRREAGAIGS